MKIDLEQLKKDLIEDEGYKNEPYFDTEGFVTFGVGRNLTANPLTPEEREFGREHGFDSEEFISMLFYSDIIKVVNQVEENFPWANKATARALCNMVFQMGLGGLLGFKNTLDALREGNFEAAGEHMLQSRWANQTPNRARRVVRRLISDTTT